MYFIIYCMPHTISRCLVSKKPKNFQEATPQYPHPTARFPRTTYNSDDGTVGLALLYSPRPSWITKNDFVK